MYFAQVMAWTKTRKIAAILKWPFLVPYRTQSKEEKENGFSKTI